MVDAVVFDVGETLVDETRVFGDWADWLGVPSHTFSAVLGAAIARGEDFETVFQALRPGFDLAVEEARREAHGRTLRLLDQDLYPDVRPCLAALREAGVWVGIAGNQPLRAGADLRALDLDAHLIATSEEWGVSKPAPEFYQRLLAEVPFPADRILYVGDRVERDVIPAQRAGLRTAWLRRGPWGFIAGDQGGTPDVWFEGLAELPGWVARQRS